MTIEQDIAAWAASRPAWQQRVLRALAQGKGFDDAAVTLLADELVKGEESAVDRLPQTRYQERAQQPSRCRLRRSPNPRT